MYFWYPQRFGVELAPDHFRQRVKDIHPDLEVTFHPLLQRWQVWYKRTRVQYEYCPGWLMLFVVETSTGERLPLDERTLAAIYQVSARAFGNGSNYWRRCEAEMARDNKIAVADRERPRDAFSGEQYDYNQIKNIGKGSKFADFHS